MKRIVTLITLVTSVALAGGAFFLASSQTQTVEATPSGTARDTIQLPEPHIFGGRALMQALRDRQSKRSFGSKNLPPQVLSNLLWAAFGVNRPGSDMRTAPNLQGIQVYCAMEEGLYLYNARKHRLDLVLAEDIREQTAIPFHWRAYVEPAPLNLIYVANGKNEGFFFAVSGTIAQNVYLYCASEGLIAVVRGAVPRGLRNVLGLSRNQTITICQTVGYSMLEHALYFPCIATNVGWETEIAVINTSDDLTVSGVLKAFDHKGMQVVNGPTMTGTGMSLELAPRERRAFDIVETFGACSEYIHYIVYTTDSDACTGYTKVYKEGVYRAGVPATREVSTGNMYLPHIVSVQDWWTRLCLLNTTGTAKEVTVTFDNGTERVVSLVPNGYCSATIADLFDGQKQADISAAVIRSSDGVVGLEIIGSENQLCGFLVEDATASSTCYPYLADPAAWTSELAAFNPSADTCTLTITPYTAGGSALPPSILTVEGHATYEGTIGDDLMVPPETAWLRVDGTNPIAGLMWFSGSDGNQMAAYDGIGTGEKEGIFPKLDKDGWTEIVLVNGEDAAATVTLTAYDDAGIAVAFETFTIDGHAQRRGFAEGFFAQDISTATYIVYTSDKEICGLQTNGSSDNTMLDALPGL